LHNWQDIRYFIEVARYGSYSAAAAVLNVNQTTVSRRVQGLEATYAIKLFHNSSKGVEMTEAARDIYQQALEIEKANLRMAKCFSDYDDKLSGKISLTMPHDIFSIFLTDTLSKFSSSHPKIELSLALTQDLLQINNENTDLAIRLTKSPDDDLVGVKIANLTQYIYKPKNFDSNKSVSLVLWDDEEGLPEWATSRFTDCYCSVRVNDLSSMYTAVKAGLGMACMPKYIPDFFNDKNVEKLNTDFLDNSWSIWLLSHTEIRQNARLKLVKKQILSALQSMKALF
jgi:DNA-binding transcriptional LysR family regulator